MKPLIYNYKSRHRSESLKPCLKYLYHLNVQLLQGPDFWDFLEPVFCDVYIDPSAALPQLARIILTQAFKFNINQAFCFFPSTKSPYGHKQYYEFMPHAQKNEKNSFMCHHPCVKDLFIPVRTALLLFDYADKWQFLIKYQAKIRPSSNIEYPYIACREGPLPSQHPCLESEEAQDWE